MKVITVCQADWCNVGFQVARSLRSVGVDALSFKTSRHNFGYAEESPLLEKREMIGEIINADVVIIMNSNYFALNLCIQAGKKNVFVYHTGTAYRRKPAEHNADFNPHIHQAFTDQTEFIGTGMKNEHYIFTAIDTDALKPTGILQPTKRLKIAHYPSNPVVKGTATIIQAVERLKKEYGFLDLFEWTCSEKNVSHPEQLKRMGACDVYVELFAPTNEGNPYGCFGVTAIEAAAMGKIVVTNHMQPEVYQRFYGIRTPFITPQTEEELYECLKGLIFCNRKALLIQKTLTRQWAEDYHGYVATGTRLKKLIFAHYKPQP